MQAVENPAQFKRRFEQLKYERDLFGFFLFDDGPSQKVVEKFANEWSEWLDELAKSARMYFFVPLRNKDKGNFKNPSLEVGKMFDIKPNELPGIVLFTLSPENSTESINADPMVVEPKKKRNEQLLTRDYLGVSDGVYLPLKAELFADDFSRVEDVFRDFFSLIQECRLDSNTPEQLLENLRNEVNSLERSQKLRPLVSQLRGALASIAMATGPMIADLAQKVLLAKGSGILISS